MRVVRFICAGVVRFLSVDFWEKLEGPRPPSGFDCDGCSSSPDWLKVTRYAVWPACVIHDFHYRRPAELAPPHGQWPSRRQADAALYRNLVAILRLQGAPAYFAQAVAWAYWSQVRLWGGHAYRG